MSPHPEPMTYLTSFSVFTLATISIIARLLVAIPTAATASLGAFQALNTGYKLRGRKPECLERGRLYSKSPSSLGTQYCRAVARAVLKRQHICRGKLLSLQRSDDRRVNIALRDTAARYGEGRRERERERERERKRKIEQEGERKRETVRRIV